ncbi:uncharacterized protein UV8b_05735 [Ustilaginoidea virens]|uniref:Uncharacterized protein n=1 Tax=Ustilaginoidea virens TaxID=1159556 RepID=A0A8E5HTZ9_USTVR|nr:uncharacterized protein UV8b_05735 [Ustilaginoidea virens]QUC21492.1 hypothetical protein UV8b_05735 [Ustilaginoidea virens]
MAIQYAPQLICHILSRPWICPLDRGSHTIRLLRYIDKFLDTGSRGTAITMASAGTLRDAWNRIRGRRLSMDYRAIQTSDTNNASRTINPMKQLLGVDPFIIPSNKILLYRHTHIRTLHIIGQVGRCIKANVESQYDKCINCKPKDTAKIAETTGSLARPAAESRGPPRAWYRARFVRLYQPLHKRANEMEVETYYITPAT